MGRIVILLCLRILLYLVNLKRIAASKPQAVKCSIVSLVRELSDELSEKYVAFLSELEQWIDLKIRQDGMREEQIIGKIKESYRRSLQANIHHHLELAKRLREAGEISSARHHDLLANTYKALME